MLLAHRELERGAQLGDEAVVLLGRAYRDRPGNNDTFSTDTVAATATGEEHGGTPLLLYSTLLFIQHNYYNVLTAVNY